MGDWYNPFDDDNLLNPSKWGEAASAVKDFITGEAKSAVGGATSAAVAPAANVPAQTSEVRQTAQRAQAGQLGASAESITFLGTTLYGGLKKGSQLMTAAANSGIQVVNNAAAFAVNQAIQHPQAAGGPIGQPVPQTRVSPDDNIRASEEPILSQLVGIVGNTDLAELAIRAVPGGAAPDMGTGFFVGGQVHDSVQQRQQEAYPSIYGHKFTVGRFLAGMLAEAGVLQEGSLAWNSISGLADFVWTMYADPVNRIPIGAGLNVGEYRVPLARGERAGAAAEVTTALSPRNRNILAQLEKDGAVVRDAEGRIAQIRNELGALENVRQTVAPNNYEVAKLSGRGQKIIDDLVAADSADAIWRASSRKIPPVIAGRLAKATTREEVINILDEAVYSLDPTLHVTRLPGITPDPVLTKIGATIKQNVQGRGWYLAESYPESTKFPIDSNPQQAARNADDILGFVKLPWEDQTINVAGEEVLVKGRTRLMNELMDAVDPNTPSTIFDWLGDFEGSVAAHLLYKEGFKPNEITRMTTWRTRLTDEIAAKYASDDMGRPIQMDWIDGQHGHGPLFNSQLLNIDPTLVDPLVLERAGRRIGAIRRNIRGLRWTADNRLIDDLGQLVMESNNPLSAYIRYGSGWAGERVLDTTENMAAFVRQMQNVGWKFNVLVQPRYLTKALPDEMARLFYSGILGDHPIQAFFHANHLNVDVLGKHIETAKSAQMLYNEIDAAQSVLNRVDSLRIEIGRAASRAVDEMATGSTLEDVLFLAPPHVDPEQFRTIVIAEQRLRANEISSKEYAAIIGENVTYFKNKLVAKSQRALEYSGRPLAQVEAELQAQIDDKLARAIAYETKLQNGFPTADEALAQGMRGFLSRAMSGTDAGESARQAMLRRGYVVDVEKTRAIGAKADMAAQYAQALSQRIGEMSANPETRYIASAILEATANTNVGVINREELINAMTAHFWNGEGKADRLRYMRGVGNKAENWDTEEMTRKWVTELYNQVEKHTFGQPELLDAIKTGKWNGIPITEHTPNSGRYRIGGPDPKANQQFVDEVMNVYAPNPAAPAHIQFFPTIQDTELFAKEADAIGKFYNWLNNKLWDGMYGRASDKLARAPMWNYAKWRAVAEVLPLATPDDAAAILKTVDSIPLPELLKDDLHAAASAATGNATAEQIDNYAVMRANEITRDSFAFKKSRLGVVHTMSLPFFDAFRELSKTFLINTTNPKFIHRIDQLMTTLRESTNLGPGDVNNDGEKEGFLFRDPDTGQEMINLKMPGPLARWWFGDMAGGVNFSIPASSLSMAFTMYPTVGPTVQFALKGVIPTSEDWKAFREYLFPFGEPSLNEAAQTFVPFIGNRNVQRLFEGLSTSNLPLVGGKVEQFIKNGIDLMAGFGGNDINTSRQRAQIMNKALVAVWASKDWNPTVAGIQQPLGQDQMDQWVAESRNLANKLWLLTSASALTPGNVGPEFYVATNKGPMMFGALKDHWNNMRKVPEYKNMSYNDQLEAFVEMYGNDGIVALLQPITDKPIQGSSATREWQTWYEQNKNVVNKNPEVGGYFGPQAAEFDDNIWALQTAMFDYKYKKPEELARAIQSAQANFLFDRAVRRFKEDNGITPAILNGSVAARDALSAYKGEMTRFLTQQIPGWDRALSAAISAAKFRKQFAETQRFVADPSVAKNPAVIAAKTYLDYRDAAVTEMGRYIPANQSVLDNQGFVRQNKTMLGLNQALFDKGEALSAQYPEFGPLWNAVLSKEVRNAIEGQD